MTVLIFGPYKLAARLYHEFLIRILQNFTYLSGLEENKRGSCMLHNKIVNAKKMYGSGWKSSL